MKEIFSTNKSTDRPAAPDNLETMGRKRQEIPEVLMKKIEDLFFGMGSKSFLSVEARERDLDKRFSEEERNPLGISENEWRSWAVERRLKELLNIGMMNVAAKAANMPEVQKRVLQEYAIAQRNAGKTASEYKEKMRLKTFGVTNAAETAGNFNIPPRWGFSHDGVFWMGEVGGKWIVVPRMNSGKDEETMTLYGPKDAFWYDEDERKRWEAGGRNESLARIVKPAIFEKNGDKWALKEKGLIDFSQDGKYKKVKEEQERKKKAPANPRKTEARPRIAEFQFLTNMKLGDRSEEVRILQEFLSEDKGVYPEGRVTGHFWTLTKRAVERFQEKYGIASPGDSGYGMVGPKTRAKLNERIARKGEKG